MAGKPGEKVLQVAYILLQKKTYKTYDEVFNQLKQIATKYKLTLNPELVLTDFEKAARKAFRFHFTNVVVKGCFFHYKQAIHRWIFKNGYKVSYSINMLFQKWFRKLACLSVVPLSQIDEAYQLIKKRSSSNQRQYSSNSEIL